MSVPRLRLAGLIVSAVVFMAVHRFRALFGSYTRSRARRLLARWCQNAWNWLGMRVEVRGTLPDVPCVYIANHRSYLDILVLAGVLDATFLSRDDISAWPIVGRAARDTGVVFVDRADPKARALAARELGRRLGIESLVVFPEGTTNGAPLPARFEGGVFRMLHRADVPVVPLTLRYSRRDVYWIDDVGVSEHLIAKVLHAGPLTVEVCIGEVVWPGRHAHAAGLRDALHAAVARPIEEEGELAADRV